MTTFNAQLARARDSDRSPVDRWHGVKGCVNLFAPYGYHATLHRLTGVVDTPAKSWIDEGGLAAAAEDLAAARRIVLDSAAAYAHRRRVEKAAGRRAASPPTVLAGSWQWRDLAYCPNPYRHPAQPLSVVVHRVTRALLAGSIGAADCPVCATKRPAERPCPNCGVLGEYG